jgi:prepilin-type N-terminal cleavage/methylation domain-containing protein
MKQSGFTLVEMAVVLVVIGLIASAVVAGKEIVEASRNAAIIREIGDQTLLFSSFSDRFRALPGDFNKASIVFQDQIAAAVENARPLNADITPEDFNGNGDNKITWAIPAGKRTGEGALAWLHLQLGGFLEGRSLLGVTNNGTAVLRSNVPASKKGSFGYYVNFDDSIQDYDGKNTIQNHLGLGMQQDSGINNGVSLNPIRTESIDKKMDDGLPGTGGVQSLGNNCRQSGINSYNRTNKDAMETVSCLPLVRLN